MTKGEKIIRVDFNVSNDSTVHTIKTNAAQAIDGLEKMRDVKLKDMN